MFEPCRGAAVILGLGASIAFACGGGGGATTPGTAGSSGAAGMVGAAGSVGGAGAAGTAAGGVGGATTAASCDEMPTPRRTAGTILELTFDLFHGAQPFVYGESNALGAGPTVIPLNFRFYLSQPALVSTGGATLPVDIVTASGGLEPYGVHLFNAEDPASRTLRVLAPPGMYTGFEIAVGLTPACNHGNPANRAFPLSATSQMTWPLPIGYLFLRYESQVVSPGDAGASAPVPRAIHMGGDVSNLDLPSAPVFRVEGALAIPTSGPMSGNVRVAVDEIFKGATADIDVSDSPLPPSPMGEIESGERLRRSAPGLHLFSFGP